MEARVNPDASVLLQASPALLDEFKYNEDIGVHFDESSGTYVLSGNWYQLEWAWTYLDTFLQQQEVIQDEIKYQPFRNNASPLDVEDGGGGDIGVVGTGAAASELERFGARESKSAFYTETVDTDRKSSGRITVAQSVSQSSARFEETTRKDVATPDRDRSLTQQRPAGGYERQQRSPAGSENEDEEEDEFDLSGRGHQIPDDSIPMSINRTGLDRRYDQDNTFDQFSGLNLEADRRPERKDNLDKDRHQQLGMSRSGKHTDSIDRQDVWLSDRKSMTSSGMQGTDNRDRGMDTNDSTDRFQPRSAGLKTDSSDNTNRRQETKQPETSNIAAKSTKSDTKERYRTADSSPDMGESPFRPKSSKGYQSLPAQGYDRDTHSPYTAESGTGSGAVGSSKDRSHAPFGETYTKDNMQYKFTVGSVDVLVLYGDLVQETTDAIVNPANSGLEHWGGASYAISRAAGPALDKECREYIAKNGHLNVADVMHTNGGNLHAFHVLHTYGPIWYEGTRKDKTEYDLTSTFLNCFNYTEKLWLKSLCVPAISTGKWFVHS